MRNILYAQTFNINSLIGTKWEHIKYQKRKNVQTKEYL